MKFERSNKFDLFYYEQVNLLRLKMSVTSKWEVNTFGGNIYFAGDLNLKNVISESRPLIKFFLKIKSLKKNIYIFI